MAEPNRNSKLPEGNRRPRRPLSQLPTPKMPRGDSFWVNLATSVLVLLLIAGAYTYFMGESGEAPQDIPISQLAQDIEAGNVASIVVSGEDVEVTYQDKSTKKSKKEPDTAI